MSSQSSRNSQASQTSRSSRTSMIWDRRHATLRDGSRVLIRPVRGSDTSLLAEGFARLSADSRWMRFQMAKKELSPAELRYFTDVDHRDHEALGALDAVGHGVGVARYIRDRANRHSAEIAVTIVDEWQRRGLGSELLARLSDRARQEGICRFSALVLPGNMAMIRLLGNMGARLVRRDLGSAEYEIPLSPEARCGGDRPSRAHDEH